MSNDVACPGFRTFEGVPLEDWPALVVGVQGPGPRDLDEPADDHTVLVHVRSVDVDGRQMREPYAQWLAEQAGLRVIGPGQRW
ncbi:hypothetical protein [Streptomyces sp. NPDC013457]|uniref:hypothetical protein n=1 Tax=Streptomyces sp. NPDC013457 TaxID=3364866 RepID=UPI0036F52FCF